MTHGHELQGGNVGGRGWAGWSGVKGQKWDNCNSIINKYIQKKDMTPTLERSTALGNFLAGAATDKHGPAQPAGPAEFPDT